MRGRPAAGPPTPEAALAGEEGQKQQGHDVGDLDHRVHGRPGGVLVGVTHCVARDGGLVGTSGASKV